MAIRRISRCGLSPGFQPSRKSFVSKPWNGLQSRRAHSEHGRWVPQEDHLGNVALGHGTHSPRWPGFENLRILRDRAQSRWVRVVASPWTDRRLVLGAGREGANGASRYLLQPYRL